MLIEIFDTSCEEDSVYQILSEDDKVSPYLKKKNLSLSDIPNSQQLKPYKINKKLIQQEKDNHFSCQEPLEHSDMSQTQKH